ncbi:MAG: PKD-like family lipoprotein [Prevotella sp.]|nr:PKD-like family lipoprotein [Prevotella sp.]
MKHNRFSIRQIFSIVAFAAISLLASCYDDKGNYDYTALDDLDIVLPSTSYTVPIDENLVINPKVVTSIPEEDLLYIWELGNDHAKKSPYEFQEFAKGKNLDKSISSDAKFSGAATFYIRLHVKQISNGRDFYSPIIKLMSGQLGLLVLHDDDSQSDIGLIVDNEFNEDTEQQVERKVIANYYSIMNGDNMIPGKGKLIFQRGGGADTENPYFHAIYAVTDNSDVAVSYTDLRKLDGGWNSLFYGGLNKHKPEGVLQSSYSGTLTDPWTNLAVFDGGEVFGTYGDGPFIMPGFGGDNAMMKGFDMAPYVLEGSGWEDCTLVFNRLTKGFVGVENFSNIYYKSEFWEDWVYPIELEGAPFNPAHMNADLVWMGKGGITDHGLSVFRRNDGSMFLAELYLASGYNHSDIPVALYEMNDLPDIKNAFAFDAYPNGNTMYANFYATPNGIWRFTVDGNGTPIVAEPLHTIDGSDMPFAGDMITMLKLQQVNGEQRMYVGTYNETTKKGCLYTMGIDPVNGNVVGVINRYDGFGKVRDVFVKHM